jgi:hypothetical protein
MKEWQDAMKNVEWELQQTVVSKMAMVGRRLLGERVITKQLQCTRHPSHLEKTIGNA